MYRRKLLGLTFMVAAIGGSALAADLPSRKAPPMTPYLSPAPVFSWSGLYIGSQIGYASLHNNQTEYDLTTVPGAIATGPATSWSSSGLLVGSHIGYQQQFASVVAGLEGDFDGSFVKGSVNYFDSNTFLFQQGMGVRNYLRGSIRGKLGYAVGRFLPYVTGGLALGAFQTTLSNGFGGIEAAKFMRAGWTLGGGLEYAVSNDWSLFGEYRYTDFGKISQTSNFALIGNQYSTRLTDNSGRIGASYHFNSYVQPVVAKY